MSKPYLTKNSLRVYPDPILRRACSPVTRFGAAFADVVSEMVELLERAQDEKSYQAFRGYAIAAPQVGILESFFVTCPAYQGGWPKVIANPRIVEAEGFSLSKEGCLSIPGLQISVRRSARVVVEYQDEAGRTEQTSGDSLWAMILQHEIDHLRGVLCVDNLDIIQQAKADKFFARKRK